MYVLQYRQTVFLAGTYKTEKKSELEKSLVMYRQDKGLWS